MTGSATEKRGRPSRMREERDYDQRIIEIARVTRVMAGGKRMRFRACVVIGDHKGTIGMASAKGADVTLAIQKAVTKAKKTLLKLSFSHGTITHYVRKKYKAAHLLIKPAPQGTGIVAGGAVRSALELSGVENIVAKMYGSKNKINNVKALFVALGELRPARVVRSAVEQPKEQV